jgi:signal transduction histidine kinase
VEISGEMGLTADEFRQFAEDARCLFYCAQLTPEGGVSIDWSVGKLDNTAAFPIGDLLEGRLQPVYAAKMRKHLDRLRTGERSEATLIYWTPGGEPVNVRDSARLAASCGKAVKILGTVSIRPQPASDHRAPIRGWLEELIESIDRGIACWTHGGKLIYTNRNFRTLCGDQSEHTLEEFLRVLARSSRVAIEGDPDDWVAHNLQNLDAQTSSAWIWSNGRSHEVSFRVLQSGIVLFMDDTTTIRTSERALLEARDLAEEASANKSRFLRAANHDLRQPLATLKILMFSALENKGIEGYSDIFEAMEVAVSVMEDILESLLQIGQLDANRVSVQKQHFQAGHLLERLRLQFEPQATNKHIEFRVVNSVVTLESDRVLLERILSNLIANAIKFTKEGGVVVGLRRQGRSVEIQVADTGAGIPADQVGLIFQEFYQGTIDTANRKRGLGLGLNIAARLAELLDHRLRVRSELGRGTVISVSVPLGDIWRSKVEQFDIDERIAGEFMGVKVIVVEDDTNLRNAISVMLSRWGVEAMSVKDGKEALETIAMHGFVPQLAIVDYSLPNGELGTDAISAIRVQVDKQLPGIVCTAEVERGLISSIRATGLPVLTKPVSPARLRSVMHHLLYEQQMPM